MTVGYTSALPKTEMTNLSRNRFASSLMVRYKCILNYSGTKVALSHIFVFLSDCGAICSLLFEHFTKDNVKEESTNSNVLLDVCSS